MACIMKSVPPKTSLVLGLFFVILGNAACGVISDNGKRIVRTAHGEGALMATKPDGLRQLNELYSLPKICTEANMRTARVTDAMALCVPVSKQTPNDIGPGLVRIFEGTKATVTGRMFVLPGGRLVEPYPSNTYDIARDGAVEIERIKITQPPNEGLEGWVYSGSLGRVGSPPL
jgi:hypothetical protein